jgi:hypothetical protein
MPSRYKKLDLPGVRNVVRYLVAMKCAGHMSYTDGSVLSESESHDESRNYSYSSLILIMSWLSS